MAFTLFVAGMALFTTHNDFRFYYHPDEKGKVRQIAEHTRNCNHPLMLLTVTSVAARFHKAPLTSQEIVQTGRAVSAFFGSAAAVALALLAWRMAQGAGGPVAARLAGWSAGILLLTDARMFDLTHYMKEDPALAMGMAVTFLALHFQWTRRDALATALAGAAAATAVSGKYIGWLLFPFAIGIVLWGCEPAARRQTARLFLKSFGLTWLVLNYSILFDPLRPFASLRTEMKGVVGGHHGLTKEVPHAAYWRMFLGLPPAVVCLFGVFLAGLLARWKKSTPPEWLVPGFALLLGVIMSFSPKSSSRYFLPVEMVACFGAGLGAAWGAAWVASWRIWRFPWQRHAVLCAVWAVLFGAALRQALPVLKIHCRAMAVDDRETFKAWIAQNLPPTAVIAEDGRVHLPAPGIEKYAGEPPLPQRILHAESAADLGTLPELRAKGVTHVAVDSATFTRFDTLTPQKSAKGQFALRKAFYASLGVLQGTSPMPGLRQVWAAPLGVNIYLQPGIRLYDITAVEPATVPSGSL